MDVTFDLAEESDIHLLADVERSAVQKFYIYLNRKIPDTTRTLPIDFLMQSFAASHLWVVRNSGKVVGFLAAIPYEDYVHIEEISIALPFQGSGIGRRFLRHFIDKSFSDRKAYVTLTTDRLIPWNYPFYKTFGFNEISLEDCPPFLRDILLRDKGNAVHPENRIAMILKNGGIK